MPLVSRTCWSSGNWTVICPIIGIALCFCASSPASQQKGGIAETPDSPVPKIIADWQNRKDRLQSIRYAMTGDRVWYKGAFTRKEPPGGKVPGPENPPKDISTPLTRKALLDFKSNRHRLELDHWQYDSITTNTTYRLRCLDACDGVLKYSRILENGDPTPIKQGSRPRVDMILYRGLIPPGNFDNTFLPLFYGHGVIRHGDVVIRPGTLRPSTDYKSMVYVGKMEREGRSYAMLRPPTDRAGQLEFWVDLDMESAVVKVIWNPSNPDSVIDIRYGKTAKGFLVNGWTWSTLVDGQITDSETVKVTAVDLEPPVKNEDFVVPLEPGMFIEDATYFIDDKTKTYKSKSSYYRIEK
jgi:hypothetical protein